MEMFGRVAMALLIAWIAGLIGGGILLSFRNGIF